MRANCASLMSTAAIIISLLQPSTSHAHRSLSSASHLLVRDIDLLARASNHCDQAGNTRCNITDSTFCCPSGMECIPLENNTSVICCKTDEFCDTIYPISCSDASSAPHQTASTTTTSSSTPASCGSASQCCPVGFDCTDDRCTMKPANLPAKYRTHQAQESQTDADNRRICEGILGSHAGACSSFPAKAIVAGFFPGLVAGAAAMLLYSKPVRIPTLNPFGRPRSISSFGCRLNAEKLAAEPVLGAIVEPPPPPPPPRGRLPSQTISIGYAPQNDPGTHSFAVFQPSGNSSPVRSPNLGPHVGPASRSTSREGSRERTPDEGPPRAKGLLPLPAAPSRLAQQTTRSSMESINATPIEVGDVPVAAHALGIPRRRSNSGATTIATDGGVPGDTWHGRESQGPFVLDDEIPLPRVHARTGASAA